MKEIKDAEGNVLSVGDSVYYNQKIKGKRITNFYWVEVGKVYALTEHWSPREAPVRFIDADGKKQWRRAYSVVKVPE